MFRNVLLVTLSLALLAVALGASTVRAAEPVFADLAAPYETIRLQLLEDSTKEVAAVAERLQGSLQELQENFSAPHAGVSAHDAATLKELLPTMMEAVSQLIQATQKGDLQTARDAFYELSKPLVRYHAMVEDKAGMIAVYCPMARRSWLQPEAAAIGNPYHGQAMAGCGNVVGE